MRAAENDFEGYSDDNSTGKGRDGAGRRWGRFCEGACRTWKVKMCASKACADTGDHGADACKHGVCRRGRSR